MFEFVNYYWNSAQQWWNPPQTDKSPPELLIHYLQTSGITFVTNQSEQKILHERLGMMLSRLIDTNNPGKKFVQFYPSNQKPLEHFVAVPIKSLSQNEKEQRIISICGKLRIEGQGIKVNLFITIVFHKFVEDMCPYVYIRNFDYPKVIPNPLLSETYEVVLGGVKIREQKLATTFQWSKYNSENLLKLMQEVNILIHKYFPFSKNKKKIEEEQIYKEAELVARRKERVEEKIETLQKIQKLQVIRESLVKEKDHLKKQISKNNQMMEFYEQNPVQFFFANLPVRENEEILELIADQKSAQDCISLGNKMFQQGKITYSEALQLIDQYGQLDFEARFKIQTFKQRKEGQKGNGVEKNQI